jgi:hypothetical protein
MAKFEKTILGGAFIRLPGFVKLCFDKKMDHTAIGGD